MPNHMPYGFYNPNMNNIPLYDNFQNNYDFDKLLELESRIKVLEEKVKILENSTLDNSKDNNNYKYDYTTSMHMM